MSRLGSRAAPTADEAGPGRPALVRLPFVIALPVLVALLPAAAPRVQARASLAAQVIDVRLSPPWPIAYQGATVTLHVLANCGSNADGVAVELSFDPAYLEVVCITPDATGFPVILRRTYDNLHGKANYDAGAPLTCHQEGNCPAGQVRIATVCLRAKQVTSPSTAVDITGQITWSKAYIFNGPGLGSTVSVLGPLPGLTPTPMGAKFLDSNRDGVASPSEVLLGGWPIRVRDAYDEIVFDTSTVCDMERPDHGHWYLPPNLPAGIYSFEELQLPGWEQTAPQTWGQRYLVYWVGDGTFEWLAPPPASFSRFDFGNFYLAASPTPTAVCTPTPTPTATARPTRQQYLPLILSVR